MDTSLISQYENSDEIPEPNQYPFTAWAPGPGYNDKYAALFEIAEDDQNRADHYLLMLVGYSLRYDVVEIIEDKRIIGQRKLKWREAFANEREALAWRAFAKDIGDFELYTMVDSQRVERTKHRDLVWQLFKARLPERVAGKPADMLENVHIKREKTAKGRGESYWRKGHAPKPETEQPPAQGALF